MTKSLSLPSSLPLALSISFLLYKHAERQTEIGNIEKVFRSYGCVIFFVYHIALALKIRDYNFEKTRNAEAGSGSGSSELLPPLLRSDIPIRGGIL